MTVRLWVGKEPSVSNYSDTAMALQIAATYHSDMRTWLNQVQTLTAQNQALIEQVQTLTAQNQASVEQVQTLTAQNQALAEQVQTVAATVKLGTAATRDVTTSPTDTTNGRVLTVGAFGLGGAVANVPGGGIDDNTIPTGFYCVTDTTSGTKPSGVTRGYLIVSREGPGATVRQLYLNNTDSRIWTRAWAAGQWSGWVEFYHSGNLPKPIGVGQTWQDMASQRARGTIYTNTTGRPIQILVLYHDSGAAEGATFRVGSLTRTTADLSGGANYPFWFSAVIPEGVTYSISGGVNIPEWWELR